MSVHACTEFGLTQCRSWWRWFRSNARRSAAISIAAVRCAARATFVHRPYERRSKCVMRTITIGACFGGDHSRSRRQGPPHTRRDEIMRYSFLELVRSANSQSTDVVSVHQRGRHQSLDSDTLRRVAVVTTIHDCSLSADSSRPAALRPFARPIILRIAFL